MLNKCNKTASLALSNINKHPQTTLSYKMTICNFRVYAHTIVKCCFYISIHIRPNKINRIIEFPCPSSVYAKLN